jgi:hypothetical protein
VAAGMAIAKAGQGQIPHMPHPHLIKYKISKIGNMKYIVKRVEDSSA